MTEVATSMQRVEGINMFDQFFREMTYVWLNSIMMGV